MTDLADAADRLQAVPLEDFVAERKRLAKELRAGGDRDGAAELAKLPKPTPPAWALNRFAREEPDAIGMWLDAAEALREASANPGPGLRDAMAAHRAATAQLLGAVRDSARPNGRPLSEPMLDRVRALLQSATADPEQADRLRAGRIVEGEEGDAPPLREPAAADRSAKPGAGTPEGRAAKSRGRASEDRAAIEDRAGRHGAAGEERAAKQRAAAEERAARERAELERRAGAAAERHARLQADAEEREAAATEASERLEAARRTLHRSESEAAAAADAAEDARAAVADAQREVEALAAKLRKAGG